MMSASVLASSTKAEAAQRGFGKVLAVVMRRIVAVVAIAQPSLDGLGVDQVVSGRVPE